MITKMIIAEWLSLNGFSGLFNEDGECGCPIDDLMPCGEDFSKCRAGYLHSDGLIYEEKP